MTSDTRTKRSRDGFETRLRQTWDITIQSGETFYVSPIQVGYWDPAADAAASAGLPALRIEPLPRDVEAVRRTLLDEAAAATRSRRYGALAIVGTPALIALALLALTVWRGLPNGADRRLRGSCRAGASVTHCLAAVHDWADGNYGYRGADVVRQLRATLGARHTERLVELQSALFSGALSNPPSPAQVATSLTQAARRNRVRDLWRGIGQGVRRALFG